MTYQQLLDQLAILTPEQLGCDVTIYDEDNDEYYGSSIDLLFVDSVSDILDVNHPILRFWYAS